MERSSGDGQNPLPAKLRSWLEWAVRCEASDLHLIVGYPPVFRLHGDLDELTEPAITPEDATNLLAPLCPPESWALFQANKSVDFSFDSAIDAKPIRFRVNLFFSGGHIGACLRVIPATIPKLDWAGFPEALADRLAFLRDGLVILTGPTGSGKTTTLAMIVNRLSLVGGYRIITIEEPVEYVFPRSPNSVVTQREVGSDVLTFADGLKAGLRQDPDVILVGEIRDRDTAQIALSAAETGHLVFTTLHTRDSKGAISRYADLFPQETQSHIRAQLALGLRAVVSQRLLPGLEQGEKQQLALEVLWNTHPVASAIRSGKIEAIDNHLVTGRAEGMITLDESIRQLLAAGKITRSTAEQNVSDRAILYR